MSIKAKYNTKLITELCPIIGIRNEDQQERFARLYGLIITVMFDCFEKNGLPELPPDTFGIIFSYFCRDYGDAPAFHVKRYRHPYLTGEYEYVVKDGPNSNNLYGYQPIAPRTLEREIKRNRLRVVKELIEKYTDESQYNLDDLKEECVCLSNEVKRCRMKVAKKLFKELVKQNNKLKDIQAQINTPKSIPTICHTKPILQESYRKMNEAQSLCKKEQLKESYRITTIRRNTTFVHYCDEKEKTIVGTNNKRSYHKSILQQKNVCSLTMNDNIRPSYHASQLCTNAIIARHNYNSLCKKERNLDSRDARRLARRETRVKKAEEKAKKAEEKAKKESVEYVNALIATQKSKKK